MSKPWDDRFHIDPSKDNQQMHDFYRAYFNKPRGQRLRSLTLPRRPSPRLSRPDLSTRVPARLPTLHSPDFQWDDRFHVSFSKDNQKFHCHFRQYFDSPKDLNYPLLSTQRQLFDERASRSPKLRRRHA